MKKTVIFENDFFHNGADYTMAGERCSLNDLLNKLAKDDRKVKVTVEFGVDIEKELNIIKSILGDATINAKDNYNTGLKRNLLNIQERINELLEGLK